METNPAFGCFCLEIGCCITNFHLFSSSVFCFGDDCFQISRQKSTLVCRSSSTENRRAQLAYNVTKLLNPNLAGSASNPHGNAVPRRPLWYSPTTQTSCFHHSRDHFARAWHRGEHRDL